MHIYNIEFKQQIYFRFHKINNRSVILNPYLGSCGDQSNRRRQWMKKQIQTSMCNNQTSHHFEKISQSLKQCNVKPKY